MVRGEMVAELAHIDNYFQSWPCTVAFSALRGRHLFAQRDVRQGERLLVSESVLIALLPSFKKRIYATCLQDNGSRLSISCSTSSPPAEDAWRPLAARFNVEVQTAQAKYL